ncbi:MAG: hypothetical protein J0L92_17850 [Deltaproteobacteria bacterium]|nr:hypothetical protein [Deltaproteobacteria bacterium]
MRRPPAWISFAALALVACHDGRIDLFDRPVDATRGCPGPLSSVVPGRSDVCAASPSILAVSTHEVCSIYDDVVHCWRNRARTAYPHPSGRRFRSIAAGASSPDDEVNARVCAIDVEGALFCWGNGTQGRLGLGEGVVTAAAPTRVGGNSWRSVAVGVNGTCGVTEVGELFCWGIGLGGGIDADGWEPRRVRDRSDWELVVGTNSHFCAVSRAGEVRCFGAFRVGPSGSTTPVEFAYDDTIDVPPILTAAAGHRSVCAIDVDQRTWCWGERRLLGTPFTSGEHDVAGPVLVEGVTASRLAVGGTTTCASTTGADPGMLCWGGGEEAIVVPERTSTRQILEDIAGAQLVTCGREGERIGCTDATHLDGPAEDGWAATAEPP